MKKFNISRINTPLGIFRITGLWDTTQIAAMKINLIEQMGTDGWVLLDNSNAKIVHLISELMPILQAHLTIKGIQK
jgi:hypothetical protein